jgi:hypothetical protein
MWKLKKHYLEKLLGMKICTSPPKMGPWFHSLMWYLHKPWSPGKEDQENSFLEGPLCERIHLWTLGIPCLLFFLGDTSLTITPCSVFPFFLFFLHFLGPPSRSRSNLRCHWCVPGGLGTMVWSWLQGPTPKGDLQVILPNFLMWISCSPSSN